MNNQMTTLFALLALGACSNEAPSEGAPTTPPHVAAKAASKTVEETTKKIDCDALITANDVTKLCGAPVALIVQSSEGTSEHGICHRIFQTKDPKKQQLQFILSHNGYHGENIINLEGKNALKDGGTVKSLAINGHFGHEFRHMRRVATRLNHGQHGQHGLLLERWKGDLCSAADTTALAVQGMDRFAEM